MSLMNTAKHFEEIEKLIKTQVNPMNNSIRPGV